MKRFLIFSVLLALSLFRVWAQDIPPKPNPPRLVNDFAKQLNEGEKAQLEQKLVAYNDSTSSQIVIVIVPTTGDYPIADYAFKIGREWGVGQKDKDNGIVLLWAPTDRKIFISTGYGMEGVIPDAIAKRIISQVITPRFKEGQFYQGLNDGVDTIFKYATGEYKADPKDPKTDKGRDGSSSPFIGFVVVFIIIMIIIFRNRNRGNRGGGGLGNFGGPIFFPYTTHSGGGSSSGNWGGGFGGGSGGGFGGFGGGSFGGGGAGGDY
ncbi:YgcG family protein [Dyadobacter sp. CY323]|uniref:TPM domain-containing protein n=1 Tax=Dyadobacter sp. CY323 TaxID=2907302 RepID=UPI001F2FBBB4|nr:TPM domain-containing protein [Dyadobacter sp. CY323]MCE6988437.1 TPM domain-containing protein [Dyadobacter sp. CY323]